MAETEGKRSLFALLEEDALRVVARRVREQEKLARKKARERRRITFDKPKASEPVEPVEQAGDAAGDAGREERDEDEEQPESRSESEQEQEEAVSERREDEDDKEESRRRAEGKETTTEGVIFTANKQSLLWRSKYRPIRFSEDDSNFHFHPPEKNLTQPVTCRNSLPSSVCEGEANGSTPLVCSSAIKNDRLDEEATKAEGEGEMVAKSG